MSVLRAAEGFNHALLEDDPVALYERAPCGYLSTTAEGLIVKANQTFLSWTGYDSAGLIGRPLTDLLGPGARIFYETHYSPMLHMQGFVRELAVELRCADGSDLPVLLNARLDSDDEGHPRVVRLAVFDATERRRYEEELLRATRLAQGAQARAEQAERETRLLVDTLQQTLVPRALPDVEGLVMHGAYRPAGNGAEVGGDFYAVYPTTADECWFLLGDVSGKGVEAAVVTSLVRHAARALVTMDRPPGQVLAGLNELLCHEDTDRYCTAVLARLRRRADHGWDVVYASGGHPPGLVSTRSGETSRLEARGLVIGLLDDAEFDDHELVLAPEQTLLLYTDGVTEARNAGGFYGESRLVDVVGPVAADGARGIVDHLVESVLTFQDQHPRDDIACLAVTVD